MQVATHELNNHSILNELYAALSRGAAVGQVGHQSYRTIETERLEAAIATARRLGCKTEEANTLLTVAVLVLRMRRAQREDAWETVAYTLQEVRGLHIPDACKAELQAATDEVENRAVVAELMTALVGGAAGGDVGALDTSTVAVTQLRSAVSRASALGTSTDEVEGLLAVATSVVAVREALLADDWAAVTEALETAARTPAWDLVAEEMDLVHAEATNRETVARLSAALATGGATGEPGALDVGAIEVAPLAAAAADTAEASIATQEAHDLLATAKLVLSLRRALSAEDWESVERVLSAAEKQPVVRSSRAEFSVARDELNHRIVESKLVAALTTGAAIHVAGVLDVSGVGIAQVDEAISVAVRLGTKTPRNRKLLASARVVRELRAALMIGDWDRVHTTLGEVLHVCACEQCLNVIVHTKLTLPLLLLVATGWSGGGVHCGGACLAARGIHTATGVAAHARSATGPCHGSGG